MRRPTSSSHRCLSSLFPVLLLLSFSFTDANARQFNQVQLRVYEKIDRFLASAVDTLAVFADFYDLGGFENELQAADRAQSRRYMYSLIAALQDTGLKPFYGLEDGTLVGYWHGSQNQVPILTYREPGNSGYEVTDNITTAATADGLLKYYNVCLNATNGQNSTCAITPDRPLYTSCNNECALVPCEGDGAVLCPDYDILELSEGENFGYVPTTMNCINEDGEFSQTPGEILVESPSGVIPDGDCTFMDGTLVSRELEGPFAACGPTEEGGNGTTTTDNKVCSTAFIGANDYINYDPRWRGWYIDCKKALVPQFSDPYIFFNFGAIGITYTHPIFRTVDGSEDGQKVFHGVLAADMELSDVTNFLETTFIDTNYTVAVYEYEEPYYIIATSTNGAAMGSVLVDDPLVRCPAGEEESSTCEEGRMTIENFEGTIPDMILRKAHHALLELEGDEIAKAVQEDDGDAASTSYVATSLTYELPGANLKWRIVVTTPVEENPDDFIEEDDGLYAVLAAVGSVGCIICFLLFLAFYRRKNEKAVQFADLYFTSAFILGAAVINLAVFAYLGKPTDQICLTRLWVFFMLTVFILSPLFIKAYRIYRLLGRPVAKAMNAKINNREAWMRTIPMILIQALILLIVTVIDPPKVKAIVDLDDLNPQKSIRCDTETYLFAILQGTYDILLLVVGCTLAYLTRNIDPRFGDAKALFFAIYNIAFTTLMLALIIVFVDITESGQVSLQFIGVFWATVFSSAAFVIPRLMAAKNERKLSQKRQKRLLNKYESQRKSRGDSSVGGFNADDDALHETEDAIKILVCTANMGNAPPTEESMKAWIPELGSSYEVTPFEESLVVKDHFDLIVIGMQEATWGSKKQRKREQAQAEGADQVSIATGLASQPSIKGDVVLDDDEISLEEAQAKEDNYLAAIEGADTVLLRKMIKEILGGEYTNIASEQRGQMRQLVWARSSIAPYIKNVKISGENTGIGNVLANKGGIIVSMTYQDTRMSFLSAHLAAHEGDNYYKARCENVYAILKGGSKTFDIARKNDIDVALSSHHIFVCGDLNFRTKFDGEHTHEEKFAMAQDLIKAEDWHALYSYDELHHGVKRDDLLVNFKTLPCDFNPTFKVNRVEGYDYKDQRVPSYTDRILFKSAPNLPDLVKQYAYEPCEEFITSDHKPVRGAFSLIPNDVITPRSVEGKFRLTFSQLECSDLPQADVSGTSDPYIKFIWDSVDMAEDSKAINFKFWQRKVSFPRTPYKSKTLNPKWEDKTMTLVTSGTEMNVHAILYLSVYDYDFFSDDDILGSLPLSMQQLVTMKPRESTKQIMVDRPLERCGRFAGRIKFKLEISQLVG
ncbi:unnamed protein product [Cylindrotheca closterium]|uniref:G-protein coupled receptors family 3 profile domain-containing protein n=1 Tax=Cylindrotheca closterium TaxID=2856 RepID=A0AAD2GDN6_9STRA|nr:unnamed protein product [Cylindrotheca closterium]